LWPTRYASTAAQARDDVFLSWDGRESEIAADMRELPSYARDLPGIEAVRASLSARIRTVITPERLKLNWSECGEHELYDLNADPLEIHNLAMLASFGPTMRELGGRIRRWQHHTGDSLSLPPI